MSLNSSAADTVAGLIVTALALPPASAAAALPIWKIVVEQIFAGVVQYAVVSPTSLAPMNVSGTPVTGTGLIT